MTAAAVDLQRSGLHGGGADTAASSSSFVAESRIDDWTRAILGGAGKPAAGFDDEDDALLQLHGDAGGRQFLLDQTPASPTVLPAQYDGDDSTASVASTLPQGASLYADNQYPGSRRSYGGDTPPAPPMARPFPHQDQQQFSGFFGSYTAGNFELEDDAEPPRLLLQALEHKPFKSNSKPVNPDGCSSPSVTRKGARDSPALAKKPRIETPSALPTFKVRKEKLGDRITALQQLVSPFGKTDTASVLHEAIEYIKFLHDQVASLSSPYLIRSGRPVQLQQQQDSGETKDGGEAKEDLRSRGLCLFPVASTYAVASETPPEFWNLAFGGTFR